MRKWSTFQLHHDKVLKWWEDSSEQHKKDGMLWYERAHHWCMETSERSGIPLVSVSGIVAALSPGCPWERNLMDAEAMIDRKKAHSFCTYPANVKKARKILSGKDPGKVLGGRKVISFHSLISNPQDPITVCIDRHAVKVVTWHEWKDLDEAQNFLNSQWDRACQVYRDVAQHLSVLPNQVQAVTWLHQRELP